MAARQARADVGGVRLQRELEVLQRLLEIVAVLAQLAVQHQHLDRRAGRLGPGPHHRLGITDVARISLLHRQLEIAPREPAGCLDIVGRRGHGGTQPAQLRGRRVPPFAGKDLQDHVVVAGQKRCGDSALRSKPGKAKQGQKGISKDFHPRHIGTSL